MRKDSRGEQESKTAEDVRASGGVGKACYPYVEEESTSMADFGLEENELISIHQDFVRAGILPEDRSFSPLEEFVKLLSRKSSGE